MSSIVSIHPAGIAQAEQAGLLPSIIAAPDLRTIHYDDFRKWLKALTLTTLVCEVPTVKLDEFNTVLKGMGGKRVS